MNLFRKALSAVEKHYDELLLLQKVLVKDSPDKLIFTEKQLKGIARSSAEESLRIAKDCAKILDTTVNPDVFFSRYQLFEWHVGHLALMQKYVKFSGYAPATIFDMAAGGKNECIRTFVLRCFNKTIMNADTMKTEKGKLSQYQKLDASLERHFGEMSAGNRAYIENEYRSLTRSLEE